MQLYEQELEQRSLADLPMLLNFAGEEAAANPNRFTRLPILLAESRSNHRATKDSCTR